VFSIVYCVVQQVYTRLSERLGVTDHLTVLNIMLQKIVVNLKAFACCEDVISHTLALFQARCASLPRDSKRRMCSPASPCILCVPLPRLAFYVFPCLALHFMCIDSGRRSLDVAAAACSNSQV